MATELIEQIKELKEQIAVLQTAVLNPVVHKKTPIEMISCECEICHKHYKNKYVLKTHMKTHSETKEEKIKVECPECHKRFCSKYYLARHISEKHSKTDTAALQAESDQRSAVVNCTADACGDDTCANCEADLSAEVAL